MSDERQAIPPHSDHGRMLLDQQDPDYGDTGDVEVTMTFPPWAIELKSAVVQACHDVDVERRTINIGMLVDLLMNDYQTDLNRLQARLKAVYNGEDDDL